MQNLPFVFKVSVFQYIIMTLHCTFCIEQPNLLELYDTTELSGVHVDAPVYIANNATWQIRVHMLASQDGSIIPLFVNREEEDIDARYDTFNTDICTGFVQVCCLREVANHYINQELSAYTKKLGLDSFDDSTCPETDSDQTQTDTLAVNVSLSLPPSSATILQNMPSSTIFALYTFPKSESNPRSWGVPSVGDTTFVYEVPSNVLREPWLTQTVPIQDPALIKIAREIQLSEEYQGEELKDRHMKLYFAYVKGTETQQVQITLQQHLIIFHDLSTVTNVNRELQHESFNLYCSDQSKPDHSLWRTDLLSAIEKCLWFCMPGYYVYPSVTDAYYANENNMISQNCTAYIKYGLTILLDLQVTIVHNPYSNTPMILQNSTGEYSTQLIMFLQQILTTQTGFIPSSSVFYLQKITSFSFTEQWGFRDILEVSALLMDPTAIENNSKFYHNNVLSVLESYPLLTTLNHDLHGILTQLAEAESEIRYETWSQDPDNAPEPLWPWRSNSWIEPIPLQTSLLATDNNFTWEMKDRMQWATLQVVSAETTVKYPPKKTTSWTLKDIIVLSAIAVFACACCINCCHFVVRRIHDPEFEILYTGDILMQRPFGIQYSKLNTDNKIT